MMEDLLADLDELQGVESEEEEEVDQLERDLLSAAGKKKRKRSADDGDEDDDDDQDRMYDQNGEPLMQDLEEEDEEEDEETKKDTKRNRDFMNDLFKPKTVHAVAKLLQSRTLQEMIRKIDEFNKNPTNDFYGPIEEHPEYRLIVASNKMTAEIENEIVTIHKFIRDNYAARFPELESLVLHPLDYARTVKAIGNATDLSKIDLTSILSSATIMVVTINASTTIGQPLSEGQLKIVMEACDMAVEIDEIRKKILAYVESRMNLLAPNVTVIVGSTIAAQLLGLAGGLTNLSKMPACNVQVLGQKKKTLVGFSSATAKFHQGFIFESSLVKQTPPDFRIKTARQVAAKVTLCARVDSCHEAPDGSVGKLYRNEISKKIDLWQETPFGKQEKPLPIPDSVHKKRRGGKKARKMKERLQMTELKKQANRMSFTAPEEETFVGDQFHGLGMLGKDAGHIRAAVAESKNKVKLSRKQQQLQQKSLKSHGGSSVSGLASSLVFTPVAGIELQNPNALEQERKLKEMSDRWFSNATGFRKTAAASASTPPASK